MNGNVSDPAYEDTFQEIIELSLEQWDISVCLASIQEGQSIPVFLELELSKKVTDDFRDIASVTLQDCCDKRQRKRKRENELIVREYSVESRPEEYESEYLDLSLSEYKSIAQQIEQLDRDMDSFKEEDWFVDSLRFYVIRAKPLDGEPVYFYRNYTKKKLLSHSPWFALWRGSNEYDRVDIPMFLFDDHIDCFSRGSDMFILQKENFHSMFHFLEEVIKTAKQTLHRIQTSAIPIANFDEFAASCEKNKSKMRKLKNIARQPYLDQLTIEDIKKVIAANKGRIKVQVVAEDGKEMLHYDPADPYGILKLLDDDYLQSIMSGGKYETAWKRSI